MGDDLAIILTAGLLATSCGLLGPFLVLRRQVLLSDAVAHAVLPGIVLVFILFGSRAPLAVIVGAGLFAVICVIGIEMLRNTGLVHADAAIALVFPALFAIGVIGVTSFASGVHLDLDSTIYGEIAFTPFRTWEVFGIEMARSLPLLAEHAEALKAAGLQRINVSLDTLHEETFQRISRRSGLNQVLEGIFAAQRVGFQKIRLNAIAVRDLTEIEIVPLGQFARQHGLELRFIEFMPLDADANWKSDRVLSGERIRDILEEAFGPLHPADRRDPSQPAVDYEFADGKGRIGLINPVTSPFCESCNRLRLTAEGKVRNCLFSTVEWDARQIMRSGGTDEELLTLVRDCIQAKKPGHGIDNPDFIRPERAMYQIGG